MNRVDKRQLVCQLYKDGKSMRQIAKEVHMSFGDIGSITKKLEEQLEPKKKETSKESQALKLFRKRKNPVDVAISLDLTPSKVAGIYKQFWKLRVSNSHNLLKILFLQILHPNMLNGMCRYQFSTYYRIFAFLSIKCDCNKISYDLHVYSFTRFWIF